MALFLQGLLEMSHAIAVRVERRSKAHQNEERNINCKLEGKVSNLRLICEIKEKNVTDKHILN